MGTPFYMTHGPTFPAYLRCVECATAAFEAFLGLLLDLFHGEWVGVVTSIEEIGVTCGFD